MAEPLRQPDDKQNEEPAHLEQRIRERAYRMWERDGHPEGRANQYWLRAEETIHDEAQAAYPPAQSRGNRS